MKSKGPCWSVPRPWTRRSDCHAASGVGLERHGDHPEIREGTTPYATRPFDASRTDPCKVCATSEWGGGYSSHSPFLHSLPAGSAGVVTDQARVMAVTNRRRRRVEDNTFCSDRDSGLGINAQSEF